MRNFENGMLKRVYHLADGEQNAVFGAAILRLYFVSEISILFRVKCTVWFILLY